VLISVVTPTLNAIRYLQSCIESTRDQQSPNVLVEHIVVDGGSTDGTVEFAEAEGCTVISGKDEGIFDAINKGSFSSNGVLLGFLGADDILLPGALDAVARAHERRGARWLVGRVRWMDARGVARGDQTPSPSWVTAPMLATLGWNCIPHPSTYLHRDFFEQLGGFDTRFKYSGDYDIFIRARQLEPFTRIARTLTGVRRHGGNASMQHTAPHSAEIRQIMERYGPSSPWKQAAYRYLLKAWANGTSPRWFLQKRVDDLRARRARSPAA
jgi:glycosyltransferase involved in cell wall biosynthesis